MRGKANSEEPKIGETVRYWANSNDAQSAVIAGFTGNATDVIIRLADGTEIVAPWGIVERLEPGKQT